MFEQLTNVDVDSLLADARNLLRAERRALALTADGLDEAMIAAAAAVAGCGGRVIASGVGKAGIAARKFSATLSSLGRPSQFLHAGDALHGELGSIGDGDVVVLFSVSGRSRETQCVVDHARTVGAGTVTITAALHSPIARVSDHVLLIEGVEEDYHSVPMASTLASIALGDALAAIAMTLAGQRPRDLGALHPAGELGRLRHGTGLVAHGGDRLPVVSLDADADTIVGEISAKGFGITGVADADGRLAGTISDGDIRRHIRDFATRTAASVMTDDPIVIEEGADVGDALAMMRLHRVGAVFVVERDTGRATAIVHIQDLLRIGVI